jgi:hypothetical protein
VSNANVVKMLQPRSFADPLTEVLRNGARALLGQAIEAGRLHRQECRSEDRYRFAPHGSSWAPAGTVMLDGSVGAGSTPRMIVSSTCSKRLREITGRDALQ